MADAEQYRIYVNYRRQVQPKQYETAAAEMTVEAIYPASLSPEEVETAGKRLFQEVKVGVFRELNLDFTQDEDTSVIMEVFKGSEVVEQKSKLDFSKLNEATTTAPEVPNPAPKPKPKAVVASSNDLSTDDLWENLASNPGNWYDNTENKTNPKAPDFRATNKSGLKNGTYPAGLWLSSKPEDLVIPDTGYAGS